MSINNKWDSVYCSLWTVMMNDNNNDVAPKNFVTANQANAKHTNMRVKNYMIWKVLPVTAHWKLQLLPFPHNKHHPPSTLLFLHRKFRTKHSYLILLNAKVYRNRFVAMNTHNIHMIMMSDKVLLVIRIFPLSFYFMFFLFASRMCIWKITYFLAFAQTRIEFSFIFVSRRAYFICLFDFFPTFLFSCFNISQSVLT